MTLLSAGLASSGMSVTLGANVTWAGSPACGESAATWPAAPGEGGAEDCALAVGVVEASWVAGAGVVEATWLAGAGCAAAGAGVGAAGAALGAGGVELGVAAAAVARAGDEAGAGGEGAGAAV